MTASLAERSAEALRAREGATHALGMVLDRVEEGCARVSMKVRDDMLNGHGTAHGGLIFALADTAFAYACNSRGVATVAQAASIAFLAPALPGEVLIATAREDMLAGRSGSYSVEVRAEDGSAVASFHGVSRAIPAPRLERGQDI